MNRRGKKGGATAGGSMTAANAEAPLASTSSVDAVAPTRHRSTIDVALTSEGGAEQSRGSVSVDISTRDGLTHHYTPEHMHEGAFVTSTSSQGAVSSVGDSGNYSQSGSSNTLSSSPPSMPSGLETFLLHSPANLSSQILSMRNELADLKEEEEEKRTLNNYCKNDLQYVWDQLISLKTIINVTKQMLEEATVENLLSNGKSADALAATLTDDILSGKVGLTADVAAKMASANILKAKIASKDELKGKIAGYEDNLNSLRKRLSSDTESLVRATNYTTKTADELIVQGESGVTALTTMSSMALRQSLISATVELESAEAQYVAALESMSALEAEIASLLGDSADPGLPVGGGAAPAPLDSSLSVEEALGSSCIVRGKGEPVDLFVARVQARVQVCALTLAILSPSLCFTNTYTMLRRRWRC